MHSASGCRVTIEFQGTLDQTAAIMKESTVEMGLVEGTPVCAEVTTAHLTVGVDQPAECALSG